MTDASDKEDAGERMVLRTVYLPPELDEKLRIYAFREKLSKGDVMRTAIARVLGNDESLAADSQTGKTKAPQKRATPRKSKILAPRPQSRRKMAASAN